MAREAATKWVPSSKPLLSQGGETYLSIFCTKQGKCLNRGDGEQPTVTAGRLCSQHYHCKPCNNVRRHTDHHFIDAEIEACHSLMICQMSIKLVT